MSLLDVSGLTIRYGANTVVNDLELFIERGESVGLVGESGSGKSQSALALLGLLPQQADVSGSIEFDGQQMLGADESAWNAVRARRISMIFQDPKQALNPYLRVGRQLREILLAHGETADVDARVVEMLHRVGLPDPEHQARAWPHELSGGMRQRVMIASALIAQPDLLIADEPTTALDVTVQAQILELLEALRDDTALLLITHDLGVVAGHCEHLVVLQGGRLVEAGRTASVFAAPRHEHMQALLAAAPRIDRAGTVGAATGEPILTAEGARVEYLVEGNRTLRAVTNVDLCVREGETLAVVGESGSGKSSLVRAILGLVPLDAGRVVYAGKPLVGSVDTRPLAQRRDLQLVFQDPLSALNPQLRVADIVGESLQVHEADMTPSARTTAVADTLQKVGLDGSYLERFPHELSGGQAQRVAIARALILRPRVLICDEAVAALDGTVREKVLELLADIQQATGLAIVFISHDLAVVRAISHRVAVMYMGHVVEVADSEALFEAPRHPYTRALIDAVPVPDPRAVRRATMLPGEIPSLLNPPGGCVFHPRCAHTTDVCRNERPGMRTFGNTSAACHHAGRT